MAKMPLAEHDNVVKTSPADRTDRPFTIPVLPRRSRRGWPIPNAHRPKAADEDVTVDGVAVMTVVDAFNTPLDRADSGATMMVDARPDAIMTAGSLTRVLQRATETIPIVT